MPVTKSVDLYPGEQLLVTHQVSVETDPTPTEPPPDPPVPPSSLPGPFPLSRYIAEIPADAKTDPITPKFAAALVKTGRPGMTLTKWGVSVVESNGEWFDPPGPVADGQYGSWVPGGKCPGVKAGVPDPSEDGHLAIITPEGSFEFYKATVDSITGRVTRAKAYCYAPFNGDGNVPARYAGACASKLSLLFGLVRRRDLLGTQPAGPLVMGVPGIATGAPVAPANANVPHGNAKSMPADCRIVEGRRLQYDPSASLNDWPEILRPLGIRAQKYGIIIRDNAGQPTLYGETTDWSDVGLTPNQYGRVDLPFFDLTKLRVVAV